MATERTATEWALFATLVVLWGSAFLMIKLTVDTIPPLTAVAFRLILALAVLYPAMRFSGQKLPPLFTLNADTQHIARRQWIYLALVGITGNALPFSLIMWGQTEIDSSLAGIFIAFAPLTTLVLAHFFLPGEPMNKAKALGFGLGFLGIVVLLGPGMVNQFDKSNDLFHQLAVFGGALSYGVSIVMARKMPVLHPMSAGTGLTLVAMLLMIPLAIFFERPWSVEPSGLSLLMLCLLGVFSTGIANVLFFFLINSAGATFVSLSNYLLPMWAVLMGAIFLSERLSFNTLAALTLILMGVGLSQLRATTKT